MPKVVEAMGRSKANATIYGIWSREMVMVVQEYW